MAIFNSYVKLPEGTLPQTLRTPCGDPPKGRCSGTAHPQLSFIRRELAVVANQGIASDFFYTVGAVGSPDS